MSFQAVRHEVGFAGASSMLGADLTIPAWLGPHPAVVLVGGRSGTRDRGRWVETLAWYGIATLSWDSPGWGTSPGTRGWQAPDERTMEVVAAVDYLRRVQDVCPGKIALLGIDTGCWAAALGAALSSHVAALVLLAPPCTGAPAQELLRLTQRLQALGFSQAETGLAHLVLSGRIRRLAAGQDAATVLTAEGPCRYAPWYDWLPGTTLPEVAAFATLANYHPGALLSSVGCPVLGVFGEDDPATPAWDNANLLHEALAWQPHREHQVLVLAHTDDAFTAGAQGASASRMPGDWHRNLVGTVSDWLAPRLGRYQPSHDAPALPRAG